jgi:3-oxoadipate enol-lactonase
VPLHIHRSGEAFSAARGTVVFIHGFPFDGSMWAPQIAALPSGWRGLAPDLRGFGRSELNAAAGDVPSGAKMGGRVALPHEPVLAMRRHADDIAELIDQEAGGTAVICGLSMGGYVALSLWRRHPDKVRALILADTRAEGDSDEGRENRMRMAQTARTSGAEPIARAMLPGILAEGTLDRNPEVTDKVRSMITATPTGTLIAALAGMAGRADSMSALPTISVPTLVVVGAEDRLTPPDVARSMAERIPGARMEVLPDSGHVSNLENPAAFNEVLAGFLAEL